MSEWHNEVECWGCEAKAYTRTATSPEEARGRYVDMGWVLDSDGAVWCPYCREDANETL